MLSQKAKYAIKARVVSEQHNIPKKFLDLILFELRQRNLIHSTRGRDGGYALARPAAQITIAEIVRAVDGPLAPLPCASVKFYRRCEMSKIMRQVRDAAAAILDNTSLAEAAAPTRRRKVIA